MRGKQTLVINGKVYDAVTGLPVAAPEKKAVVAEAKVVKPAPVAAVPAAAETSHVRHAKHARNAHSSAKKSATLHRQFLAKPADAHHVGAARRKPEAGHVERSPQISKFAAHPQPIVKPAQHKAVAPRLDITPVKTKPAAIVAQKHALVAPAASTEKSSPALSTRSVKEQLIADRLATVDAPATTTHAKKKRGGLFAKTPRRLSLVTASFAVMVLGGYFTYLNMPALSVRVAAAQADVAASFPDYNPDGYRFNGPVAYAPGQVAIDFVANGGTSKYTVTEQKSTWDSQAVYDNIVAKASDDSYVTNSQQGLTIYTFTGEAAWVNKGILYTISGDAPLSNEQLLRIAGSL